MRSRRERPTFEEMAIERDRELGRRAAESAQPPPVPYDASTPLSEMMVARESAAAYGDYFAEPHPASVVASDARLMIERLLVRVRHVLYSLDVQQQEIVRLRENTRGVLVRLSAA